MNLFSLVSEIQKNIINSDIDYVNDGGCGYFAYYVANELEKHGIQYKIKVIDEIRMNGRPIRQKVESINKFITDNIPPQKKLISFTHCWIEIPDKMMPFKFDGEITNREVEWEYEHNADFSGYFSKKELKVALKFGLWNPMYKKSQNRKLRAAIRQAFEGQLVEIK